MGKIRRIYLFIGLLFILKLVNGQAPTVTITAQGPTSFCQGGSVLLTAQTTGSAIAYQWINASGNINGQTTSSYTASLADKYQLIVSNGQGTATSNSITVTIYALPTISGTLKVCVGATTQLSATGTPQFSNPWVSLSTSIATVNRTGLVTGVSSGQSNIIYTTNRGCTDTVTVTVGVTITGIFNICPIGSTSQLTGSGTPATTNPWVSGTTSVATVSNTGLVTAVSNGTSVITYTDIDGCSQNAAVTVGKANISGNSLICQLDSTSQLTGSGIASGTNPWTSDDSNIATVSKTGLVTGVAAGTSVITYTDNNGCSQTLNVTIANTVITGNTSVCVGSNTQLTGSGTAAGNNPWISSDPTVATVSKKGVVSGQKEGTAIITFTNTLGCSNTATVRVNPLPTVTGIRRTCTIGSTIQLAGSGNPSATNPWVSSNTGIATVNNTGLVTDITAGTIDITYTDINGCSQSLTLSIGATITGSLAVCAGSTTQLTGSDTSATTNPWISASIDIATIDDKGLVTGVTAGTSVITYTNSRGCVQTAKLTVNALPEITGNLSICLGTPSQLTGSGSPASFSPWTSSKRNVANVSNTGSVSGVSAGTSVITYTDNNGCSSTVTVVVYPLPTISGNFNLCPIDTTSQLTGSGSPSAFTPWSSGSPNTAIVNNTGLVKGIKPGSSLITYTDTNGCKQTATVIIGKATITGIAGICQTGSTTQLTGSGKAASVNPWISSSPAVATVDKTGLVTGESEGTSKITYTNTSGCMDSLIVTVGSTITGNFVACIGTKTQLTGLGAPASKNPWVSATTSVATVTGKGLVTGVAAGTSDITFTNIYGCSSTVIVTVKALPTISGTLSICIGGTTQLSGSDTPATTNPWTSGSIGIAKVDNTGLVTGIANGTSVITYTNSDGCSKTATVTVNALPNITGAFSLCAGSTSQLNGNGSPASSNPWLSSNTNVATVDNTGLVTGISSGSSIITYTNLQGCSKSVTVIVGASILGPQTVCAGSAIQLIGSGTPSGTNPWVSDSTDIATVTNTGQVKGIKAGTSKITYTNSCSTDNSVTITITVNALPVITGNMNVCVGTTTQLSSTDLPAAHNAWVSKTTTIVKVDSTGLVTGLSTNSGPGQIVFTNNLGCSQPAIITVNLSPTISGTLIICPGSTSQLSGSGSPAASNPWVSGSTNIATVDNTGLVTGITKGTSIITYTNSFGCSSTSTINIGTVVTGNLEVCVNSTSQLTGSGSPATSNPWVSSAPNIATVSSTGIVTGVSPGTSVITYTNNCSSFNTTTVTVKVISTPVITGTLSLCAGSATQLTGSDTAAAVKPWVSGSTNIAVVNNTGLVTGVAGGTSVITYTTNKGCSKTATVTVNALPSVTGALTFCEGSTTQLKGSGTPAGTNPWISDIPSIATVDNTGLVTAVSSGSCLITYTNINGCSRSVTVVIFATPPKPTISRNGNTLKSSDSTGNQWYNKNGAINGDTSATFNPVKDGDYYVIVTINDCSSDPSDPYHFVHVGTNSYTENVFFNIYPNPNNGNFIIQIEASKSETYIIEIWNVLGEKVYSQRIITTGTKDIYNLNISNLANGLYSLRLNNPGKEYKRIFVISK